MIAIDLSKVLFAINVYLSVTGKPFVYFANTYFAVISAADALDFYRKACDEVEKIAVKVSFPNAQRLGHGDVSMHDYLEHGLSILI